MKKLIDLRRYQQRPDRPTKWRYLPIAIDWCKTSHAWITWHGWPINGSEQWPDGTFKTQGWTIHIGPLKIIFGGR